jgi:hypothetical protein
MRIDGDNIKWRSGREEYANQGIIGLGKDDQGQFVTVGGYSSCLPAKEEELSKEERVELAEHMIIQWKLFGAKEVKN